MAYIWRRVLKKNKTKKFMKVFLVPLLALMFSFLAKSEEYTNDEKIQIFELSIMLEPIIKICDKNSSNKSNKFHSLFEVWANDNILIIVEGLDAAQKSYKKQKHKISFEDSYQKKTESFTKFLDEMNTDELKLKCKSAYVMLR